MVSDGDFKRIAIVGVGLIGGSIALAAARRLPSLQVVSTDLGGELATVAGADLVILAAPIRTNISLLAALDGHLAPGTLVTDTGSTKRAIVGAASELRS